MKEIKAIVRPARLNKVRESLRELPNFPGMTITHVEGCSGVNVVEDRQDSLREELTDFTKKIHIEILAPDEMVQQIVDTIHKASHTGQAGDGLVWTTDVIEFRRMCKLEG